MELNPSVKMKHPDLTIAYAIAQNVKVERIEKKLEDEKKRVIKEIKSEYESTPVLEIPELEAYREFYRTLRVDPTKVRPPIEYLLRKVMGGNLPSINTLVDLCLLASVKNLAIISVYDLDNTKGSLTVDLAKGNEKLHLIAGKTVTLAVGEVLLRDEEKILTGYIHGDAESTMVSTKTKNALLIAWNAPGIGREKVEAVLNLTAGYIMNFCQGTIKKRERLA